jgi:DNA-binding SARP family transcriptional activator/tetratricopeptide (TPR) repeat protein
MAFGMTLDARAVRAGDVRTAEGNSMEFVILGPTRLSVDGQNLPLGAAKQRGLLAMLLYRVGEPVRIDTIVEQLWGERRPHDYRVNLYTLTSRIRAALKRAGVAGALVRIPHLDAYRLDVDPELVDFHRFRRMLAEARDAAARQDHPDCSRLLAAAIDLWRDEPLADLREAPAQQLRDQMTSALLEAHKLLAGSLLRMGNHHAALVRLEPVLAAHDLDETLAQYWIDALCLAGRTHDARDFALAFRRRFRKVIHADSTLDLPPDPARSARSRHRGASGGPETPPGTPPPRQLPNDINDFIGREDLLAELDRLTHPGATGAKIVVISGMPGAGKTTLATHWAHRHRQQFPDGQLYLNANAHGPSPPTDPDSALTQLLHALEPLAQTVPASAGQRRARLAQLLANKRVLIVLDNVRDSNQVRPLLPASDTCVILITSRNRLRGLSIRDGARSMTVPPLSDGECLDLLTRLIGAPRAHTESPALEALTQLSGGLPLGLRIIGEHVAERPLARIGDLVNELSTDLLDCEDDEEATLRTVFAWSYNALEADAARLFRLLALHPGTSISPEAAGALIDAGTHDSERLLNVLAKAHLINHDTARRYRFHDLLRLYAGDRVREEESAHHNGDAQRRLLDWYLLSAVNAATSLDPQRPPVPDLPVPGTVEPRTFRDDAEAMRWCESERSNFAALTRFAAANGFPRRAWQLPGTVLDALGRYGRQDDMLELNHIALASAREDRHPMGQIGSLNNLGAIYFARHDHPRATANVEAALKLAREAGYLDAETICLHNLGSIRLAAGDIDTAVRLYHRVLGVCRSDPNPAGEASTLHRLGDAHRQAHRYGEAITHYRDALAIRQRIGSARGEGTTHAVLAATFLETGAPETALWHCRQALAIFDRIRDDVARCDTLVTCADVRRELGMYRDATQDAQDAIALSEEIADSVRHCQALAVLADIFHASGNLDAAARRRREALGLLDGQRDPDTELLRARLSAPADPAPPR